MFRGGLPTHSATMKAYHLVLQPDALQNECSSILNICVILVVDEGLVRQKLTSVFNSTRRTIERHEFSFLSI